MDLPEGLLRLISDYRIKPLTNRINELENENENLKKQKDNMIKLLDNMDDIVSCDFCQDYYYSYNGMNSECVHDLYMCDDCCDKLNCTSCTLCGSFLCPKCSSWCVHCNRKIEQHSN